MADYRRASFFPQNPNTYDGNGIIHQSEKERGIKLIPDKSGKGFRKVGNVKDARKLATLQDDSATKQIAEIEQLKKDNASKDKQLGDAMALIKDMDKRVRYMEDKKETN